MLWLFNEGEDKDHLKLFKDFFNKYSNLFVQKPNQAQIMV